MIALTLAILFAAIAIATGFVLVDCAMRFKSAHASLVRQQALVKAGFVPQVEASAVRLRSNTQRTSGAARPFATRLPAARAATLRAPGAA